MKIKFLNINTNVKTKINEHLNIVAAIAVVCFLSSTLIISHYIGSTVSTVYLLSGISIFAFPSKLHKYWIVNIITLPITLWLILTVLILSVYFNAKTINYSTKDFFYNKKFDDYDNMPNV